MLIYNFQKEFLGIDEKDLLTLGYKDLSELRAEVTDFADLFVKTPGYIHNFKHVHWIDYITCAESTEESKVIIHANEKNYRAVITVTYAYLIDNPNQKAYFIHLNNLRALTPQEYDAISGDITQKPAPQKPSPQQVPPAPQIKKEKTVTQDKHEILDVGDLSFDTHEKQETVEKPKETPPSAEPQLHVEAQKEKTVPKEKTLPKEEVKPKSTYTYDPTVASKELGLPLDLIEEFLQDFINQANDFKTDLYKSLDEGDIDNVKILSHKLKGVAANLRIEDAYEILSIINASSDIDIIHTNLNDFYTIIAKLAGEEKAIIPIKDEEVPQKIDIPELCDDEFVAPEESEELLTFKEDEPELTLELQEETPELEIDSQPQEKIEIIEEESEDQYSKEKIANEIGLDINSFNELFEEFIKEAHTIMTKIYDALAIENYQTLKQLALKFKGMSDNMRMHTFTKEVETLIYSTDKNALTQAVNEIKNRLTTISKEKE